MYRIAVVVFALVMLAACSHGDGLGMEGVTPPTDHGHGHGDGGELLRMRAATPACAREAAGELLIRVGRPCESEKSHDIGMRALTLQILEDRRPAVACDVARGPRGRIGG